VIVPVEESLLEVASPHGAVPIAESVDYGGIRADRQGGNELDSSGTNGKEAPFYP